MLIKTTILNTLCNRRRPTKQQNERIWFSHNVNFQSRHYNISRSWHCNDAVAVDVLGGVRGLRKQNSEDGHVNCLTANDYKTLSRLTKTLSRLTNGHKTLSRLTKTLSGLTNGHKTLSLLTKTLSRLTEVIPDFHLSAECPNFYYLLTEKIIRLASELGAKSRLEVVVFVPEMYVINHAWHPQWRHGIPWRHGTPCRHEAVLAVEA